MPAPRCYALKFEGQADRNMFFWMQEPKAEDDARLVATVNAAIGSAGASSLRVRSLCCNRSYPRTVQCR